MNKLQVEVYKAKKQIVKAVRKKHPNTDSVSVSFELTKGYGLRVTVHPWEGDKLPNSYYPPIGSTINQIKNHILFE